MSRVPFLDEARWWLRRLFSADPRFPDDPVVRRKSRLLSAFLMIAIAVFGLVDIVYAATRPGYTPPWYGYAFLLGAWLLNRWGRYRAAASVTLAMFPLVIVTLVVSGASAEPRTTLSYLVPGILLASILLAWRGVAVFALVSLGVVLVTPAIAPDTAASLSGLVGPFSLVALVAGLSLVFLHHRDHVERDRQAELRASEERLRVALEAARTDITERQRVEAEREALIRELEMKNAELERFTYTVSHDLKSPLVTIRGFLGYIESHAAAGRMESLREDLARVEGATDRMRRLLDELLHLSRIGRVGNPPEDVGLAAVAAEAVALARGRLDAKGIGVEIAPDLPTVQADRVRLLELVQNLVDNAIRFAGERPDPRIHIGWRAGDESPVVFVRDNGIGIDPNHHERVFGLFDKLEPGTEGTGVGLALARRIAEVHGGRIWIESEGRGRGTTVCFTLPGAPPPAPVVSRSAPD